MKYTALAAAAVLFTALPAIAQEKEEKKKPVPDGEKKEESGKADKEPAKDKEEGKLPEDVQNFTGEVTGTVEKVNAEKSEVTLKVTAATAGEKSKAPKPGALVGMSITITPIAKKDDAGGTKLEEAASEKIKALKVGEPATLKVRTSSKGKVFRLLTK